jgi:hypothetical protein
MVQNVNVLSAPNSYGEFNISDGSGSCQVDNQFFDMVILGAGYPWVRPGQKSGLVDIPSATMQSTPGT